jgi:hypothetical protein
MSVTPWSRPSPVFESVIPDGGSVRGDGRSPFPLRGLPNVRILLSDARAKVTSPGAYPTNQGPSWLVRRAWSVSIVLTVVDTSRRRCDALVRPRARVLSVGGAPEFKAPQRLEMTLAFAPDTAALREAGKRKRARLASGKPPIASASPRARP